MAPSFLWIWEWRGTTQSGAPDRCYASDRTAASTMAAVVAAYAAGENFRCGRPAVLIMDLFGASVASLSQVGLGSVLATGSIVRLGDHAPRGLP